METSASSKSKALVLKQEESMRFPVAGLLGRAGNQDWVEASRQRSNELGILKEVIRAIDRSSDRNEILELILSQVSHLFHADVCRICLCDRKKQFHLLAQERKRRGARAVPRIVPGIAGSPLCSRLLPSSDRSLGLFEDLRKHPRLQDTCLGRQVRSCVCVPIRSKGALLGGLCVASYTRDPGLLAASHLDFLEALGTLAALAIEDGNEHGNMPDRGDPGRNKIHGESRDRPIIGRDEKLESVLEMIRAVASSKATVLILGETGTGKELVARACHEWGNRAGGKFVAQNCAALPESLLESELFGHTKGAFTGALVDKMGLFEVADGGTLFLDEIAELSPRMQTILLRAIEEGEIRRLGATEIRKVNVRVIAATSGDLECLMEERHFRRELFYRLNVVTVRLPSLRHRVGDIPLLTQHFLSMYSRLSEKHFSALEPRALAALERYHWPGNIRELENEIYRAVILSEPGDLLRLEALSEKLQEPGTAREKGTGAGGDTFDESLRAAEARHILQILQSAGGAISTAAERLKIHRNTLTRKVSNLGIRTHP